MQTMWEQALGSVQDLSDYGVVGFRCSECGAFHTGIGPKKDIRAAKRYGIKRGRCGFCRRDCGWVVCKIKL